MKKSILQVKAALSNTLRVHEYFIIEFLSVLTPLLKAFRVNGGISLTALRKQ